MGLVDSPLQNKLISYVLDTNYRQKILSCHTKGVTYSYVTTVSAERSSAYKDSIKRNGRFES